MSRRGSHKLNYGCSDEGRRNVANTVDKVLLTCIKANQPHFCQNAAMKLIAKTSPIPLALKSVRKTKNDLAEVRLAREWTTITTMTRIYCRDHHHPANRLCADCEQFLGYANARLERCRFGAEKPACAKCPVHCYQRERREQVRVIMRYAGPRMLWEHPLMVLRHWLDGFRKAPGD